MASSFLTENDIPHRQFDNVNEVLDIAVERLIQGKVVGWFQGRFEWGPRALGNRSILADPRNPEMKNIISLTPKYQSQAAQK